MNIVEIAEGFGRSFKHASILECISRAAGANRRLQVHDPGTGKLLTSLSESAEGDLDRILRKAQNCFTESDFSRNLARRAVAMEEWAGLIQRHHEDIALVISLEGGKIFREACSEVAAAAAVARSHANYMQQLTLEDKRSESIRIVWRPFGVTYAVTPWNFPVSMVSRKIAPALAAGCPVIIKPDHRTPLSCLILVELAKEAGFPDGSVNIVLTSDSKWLSERVLADPLLVQRITFTGSTKVGYELAKLSGIRPICLELGGLAPFIVEKTADVQQAVSDVVASRFRHSGQTCICGNRLVLDASIYDHFIDMLKSKISLLKYGHQLEDEVNMGPLIDNQSVKRLQKVISDHHHQGHDHWQYQGPITTKNIPATILFGGPLDDNEIFGPVLRVYKFTTKEEALRYAFSSYGLAAYLYSHDDGFVEYITENLQVGMLGVNTVDIVSPDTPFSGCRLSGHGIEGCAEYSIREYLRPFAVCTLAKN